jgi:hypothetical protein
MADTFTTMQDVTEEALVQFHNQLGIVKSANKDVEPQFLNGHWDKGNTIKVRKPNRHIVSDGATIASIPDTVERTVDLTLNYRKKVVMDFTTSDLTHYARADFTNRFITPAAIQLANKVERITTDELVKKVYNHIGQAGTAPSSYANLTAVKAFLNKLGIPEEHYFAMQEDNYASLISNANLQNSFLTPLNEGITRKYMAGALSAMDIMHSIFPTPQTAGIGDVTATPSNGYVACGTVKTNVANLSTSITLTGLGTQTGVVLKGDKIYIEGFYSINPLEKELQTGEYIEFTVLADANSASGDATVSISPTVRHLTTDPYQNVNAQITAGAKVYLASANTGVGSTVKVPYKINTAYHRDAVQFAAPPLMVPKDAVSLGSATNTETGISLRIIEKYDIINDKNIIRLDILFGVLINAEYAIAYLG